MDERGGNTSNTTGLLHEVVEEGGGERPKEPWKGEYVKSIVYGGLDAIITCFSLISSISASSSSSGIYICCSFLSLTFSIINVRCDFSYKRVFESSFFLKKKSSHSNVKKDKH